MLDRKEQLLTKVHNQIAHSPSLSIIVGGNSESQPASYIVNRRLMCLTKFFESEKLPHLSDSAIFNLILCTISCSNGKGKLLKIYFHLYKKSTQWFGGWSFPPRMSVIMCVWGGGGGGGGAVSSFLFLENYLHKCVYIQLNSTEAVFLIQFYCCLQVQLTPLRE